MTNREQYVPYPASTVEFFRLWSDHVDSLENHLSTNTWALAAVTVMLVAYPIARFVVPVVLNELVPQAVRTALHLI
jgi:hypothetical protein